MTHEESQRVLLEILRVFDAFCAQQGLCWWLVGGSALGAVRHKGFIPWDDDIDIGMPRNDYQRFLECYQTTGPYALVSMENTAGYFNPYAKLCDTRTLFVEPTSLNVPRGLFVDMFPFDNVCMSDGSIRKAILQKRLYNHAFVANLKADEYRSESLAKRAVRKLMSLCYAGKDPLALSRRITASIARDEPTGRVISVWGAWGMREVMPREWFGEGVRVPFEDMECPVPNDWDSYLHALYGDYMTPPAVKPRPHGSAYWVEDDDRVVGED